ncbi:hypothetical protein CU098_002937, partial [Rhizopus stolonifer]
IKDIKLPYESYIKCFISNLNQRQDVICTLSVQQFLTDTNKTSKSVTLESLCYAPLQQIKTYKSLLNKTNAINQSTLLHLHQSLDTLMNKISLLPKLDLAALHTHIDCTQVIDFISGSPIQNYQLPALSKALLCDTFSCTEIEKRVQLVLSDNKLIFCTIDGHKKYSLLYTPIAIEHILIRTIQNDRELIGEYEFQLWINKQRIFTIKANSKETRNMWLGLDINSSLTKDNSALSNWMSLTDTVAKYDINPASKQPKTSTSPKPIIQTANIFTFYTDQSGEVSPLVSSDEESEDEDNAKEITDDIKSHKNLPILPSSPLSSSTDMDIEQKSLPPTPEITTIPATSTRPPIVSGTQSLPTRKHSLSNPPEVPMPLSKERPSSPSKKPSFMRSVIGALSNRASLRPQKSNSKLFVNDASDPPIKSITKNLSAVSLSQQTNQSANHTRRHSASSMAEPPALPHHHTLPLPHSPFAQRGNSHSASSFTSVNTSSQSSLASTPSLSRASSPGGSMTPVRHQPSSSSSSEDLGSPPKNPDMLTQTNAIKSVLYSNDQCQVFHWKDESWYAVDEECLLEVCQTFSNRSCITIHMKNSRQLYLNAWVLPDTFIIRTTETDLSLSLHIANGNQTSDLENYLFHCPSKAEADRLTALLEQMHRESVKVNNIMMNSANDTLHDAPPVMLEKTQSVTEEEIAKSFKLVMQCKCKLYVQNASSKWGSFGSVYMKVSQNYNTKRMHVAMESHKGGKTTQLVSAMIQSRNVERLGPKRITFLLVDEIEKTSVVYMIQVREENTGDKIIEYTKTKNAENGW